MPSNGQSENTCFEQFSVSVSVIITRIDGSSRFCKLFCGGRAYHSSRGIISNGSVHSLESFFSFVFCFTQNNHNKIELITSPKINTTANTFLFRHFDGFSNFSVCTSLAGGSSIQSNGNFRLFEVNQQKKISFCLILSINYQNIYPLHLFFVDLYCYYKSVLSYCCDSVFFDFSLLFSSVMKLFIVIWPFKYV